MMNADGWFSGPMGLAWILPFLMSYGFGKGVVDVLRKKLTQPWQFLAVLIQGVPILILFYVMEYTKNGSYFAGNYFFLLLALAVVGAVKAYFFDPAVRP